MRERLDAHDRRMAELKAMAETGFPKLDEKYKAFKERIRSEYEIAWTALADRWRDGMNQAAAELDAVNREVDCLLPRLERPAWTSRPLPKLVPPVIRFGKVPLELASLPGGVSTDADLMEGVPASFDFPALQAVPRQCQPVDRNARRGSRRGARGAPGVDVPPADQLAAGPGSIHDRRPDRHRPQFRRVHAPGRLRRCARHQPGLDRPSPDRGAARRPGRSHGNGDAEIPAQRVRHDRRIQRRRRRGRRALPRAGRRRLPDQVRREVGSPPGRDRRRRRPLRRADPGRRRHVQAPSSRFPARRAAPALRPPDLGCRSRAAWSWDDRDFGRYPLSLDAPPPAEFATRQIQKVGAAARDAKRVEVPFEFISSADGRLLDPRQPRRNRRSARQGRRDQAPALHARAWHFAACADRRAHRLGQVDLDARPDHQPRPELQPRRDRPLPDRLQEGRRVQGLRHARAAARERRRDRERARVRHQRARAARRRAAPAGRPVPRRRRAGRERLSQRPGHAPRCPASC